MSGLRRCRASGTRLRLSGFGKEPSVKLWLRWPRRPSGPFHGRRWSCWAAWASAGGRPWTRVSFDEGLRHGPRLAPPSQSRLGTAWREAPDHASDSATLRAPSVLCVYADHGYVSSLGYIYHRLRREEIALKEEETAVRYSNIIAVAFRSLALRCLQYPKKKAKKKIAFNVLCLNGGTSVMLCWLRIYTLFFLGHSSGFDDIVSTV